MAVTLGKPVERDIERSEDDTDDIAIKLTDSGALVNTTGYTVLLSIGPDDDSAPTVTFSGSGTGSDGLIPIDMAAFALAKGPFKYDIRITNTNLGDSPARVYFKGNWTVTPRIN